MQSIKLKQEDIIEDTHLSEGIVMYLKSSGIRDFQHYHAGLRRFAGREHLTLNSSLKSSYECISEKPEITGPRTWTGTWRHKNTDSSKSIKVYSKFIHLVDPITFMQRSQLLSYIPAPDSEERDALRRHAISRHNQASVDATVCYILSRIGELGLTPNAIQYLDTVCGVANGYNYKITDEFMTMRADRSFWSLAEGGKQLVIEGEISDQCRQWLLTPPKDDDEMYQSWMSQSGSQTDLELSNSLSSDITLNVEPLEVKSDLPDIQLSEANDEDFIIGDAADDSAIELFNCGESVKASPVDEALNELETIHGNIYLKCPNIPVLICFQEAADGTMDELLGTIDEEDGILEDSAAERQWSAWLFQVVAALSVYQKYVCFCHNDLHTNNIVFVNTEEEFLYYKNEKGDYYKVPTYGKIFKIIDFGRATCEIGTRKIMSSDFAPGEDAFGQYNWGPFFDPEEKVVAPNMSFDLCRLAVSLFEILYPDETIAGESALGALLWRWMLDDSGASVLYDDDGDERFPGFELYVHIAEAVHGAVPAEQFAAKPFSQFRWKGKEARFGASKVRAYPIFTGFVPDDI
jgi:hypothetical protein